MIVLKACVLYVISGVGGFATTACYTEGTNILMVSSPDYVYQVEHVPKEVVTYRVADSVVEYWTEPSIRVTFGTYLTYERYRPSYRKRIFRRPTPRTRPRPRPRALPRMPSPAPRTLPRRHRRAVAHNAPAKRRGMRRSYRNGRRVVKSRPSTKRSRRVVKPRRSTTRNRNVRRNRRN